MKSKLLLSLLLGGAAALALPAQTSVWKVTRGGNTVYLGGTCHVLRAADYPLPTEFDRAFAQARALYFETDIARLLSPEMQQVVATRGVYQDGTTLDKVLTPEAWQAVQHYAATSGLPLAQFSRFKPWLFVTAVAALELQKLGVTDEGVDIHFYKAAAGAGKTVHGLEAFERQLDFLTSMGAGHESELVVSSLDELKDLPKEMPELIAAWRTGNTSQIDRTMLAEVRQRFPAIYAQLIVQRNRDWLPVIDGLLKTPEIEFVLVGAAHLAGPDGLLEALKKKGCKVEQWKGN